MGYCPMHRLFRRGSTSKGLPQTQAKPRESFRPNLERLEDRTLLSVSGLPSAVVSYLGTPAGQVFLGEIISQSQAGTLTNNLAMQDGANATAILDMMTALGWSPLPPGSPPPSGLMAPSQFPRSTAGLIYLGETLSLSSNTATGSTSTQQLLLAEAAAAALAALGFLPQPAGPQGASGPQGEPGPAGPAGPSSISTFSAYSAEDQNRSGGDLVTFTNTGPSVGNDITFTAPGTTFTINTAGHYRIDFVITDPGEENATILQNGNPIPGSPTLNQYGGNIVGMLTITANRNDTISIDSNGGGTVNGAQIVITKLD